MKIEEAIKELRARVKKEETAMLTVEIRAWGSKCGSLAGIKVGYNIYDGDMSRVFGSSHESMALGCVMAEWRAAREIYDVSLVDEEISKLELEVVA